LPSRSQPPQGMPAMTKGSQPTDGGNLIRTDIIRYTIKIAISTKMVSSKTGDYLTENFTYMTPMEFC
jgi:hypothetical protein